MKKRAKDLILSPKGLMQIKPRPVQIIEHAIGEVFTPVMAREIISSIEFVEPKEKAVANHRGYYRHRGDKKWGYKITFPIEDCKLVDRMIMAWKNYHQCGGRSQVTKYGAGNLALKSSLSLNFDAFVATADVAIIPSEQPKLQYVSPEELDDELEEELEKEIDPNSMSIKDIMTMMEVANAQMQRKRRRTASRKKADTNSYGLKLVKPTKTSLFADSGSSGRLVVFIPTRMGSSPANNVTMHFLVYCLASIVVNAPYDPLNQLSRSIRIGIMGLEEGYGFSAIGGYEELKNDLRTAYLDRYENPDLHEALNLNLRNYLFAGPAGTGKSMMLRALMTELADKLNVIPFHAFFSANKSEFEQIFSFLSSLSEKTNRPTVLLYDEIDDMGKARSDDRHELGVNDLLRTLDGVMDRDVSLVATTNRPHTLDPALLRPGRLSPVILFGSPQPESRESIFRIYLDRVKSGGRGKVSITKSDMASLVKMTEGFTGADIKEMVDSVLYRQLGDNSPLKITLNPLEKIIKANRDQKVSRNNSWNEMVKKSLEGNAQVSMIYH